MINDKKVELTKKDFLNFRYSAFLYNFPGLLMILCVVIVCILILADYLSTGKNIVFAALSVFIIVAYCYNIIIKLPKDAISEFESGTFPNPKYTISLKKDELSILRDSSSSNISLKSLHSVFETFSQFCFFVSQNNYIILPKTALSAEEIGFVKDTIKTLPRGNRKNPFSSGIKKLLRNLLIFVFVAVCAILVVISYKIG